MNLGEFGLSEAEAEKRDLTATGHPPQGFSRQGVGDLAALAHADDLVEGAARVVVQHLELDPRPLAVKCPFTLGSLKRPETEAKVKSEVPKPLLGNLLGVRTTKRAMALASLRLW